MDLLLFFIFAIPAILVGSLLWLVRPAMLTLFVWPLLLLYPQAWFENMLPWNIGLDDLFIVLLGVRMIFYHPPHGTAVSAFPVLLLVGALCAAEVLADFTGALSFSQLLPIATRTLLKSGTYLLFTLMMVRVLRTEADVRRHLTALGLSLTGAFVIILLCSRFPFLSYIWEPYASEEVRRGLEYLAGTERMRSWGTFGGPYAVGTVLCVVVPLSLGLLSTGRSARALWWTAGLMLASGAVAAVISKSRSGMVGLAAMGLVMALLSRHRSRIFVGGLLGGAAVFVLAMTTNYLDFLTDRFTPEKVVADFQLRWEIWADFVSNPSLTMLAFGEGVYASSMRMRSTPHNGYLDILFLWGIGGTIVFTWFIWRLVSLARNVMRNDGWPVGRAVAWGTFWSLIAVGAAALTGDPWFVQYYRFLMFFLLVVLWQRRHQIEMRVSQSVPAQEMPPMSWR